MTGQQHSPRHRLAHRARLLTLAAAGLVISACGAGTASAGPAATSARAASPGAPQAGQTAKSRATASIAAKGAVRGTARGGVSGTEAGPLAGKVVGIDPGHNGRNKNDPADINHLIWNGREWETCNTTGTETDSGYTEARYNFNVASYLRADLRRAGARVVMTRTSNHGVGPCVNRRAAIINHGHASAAVDIHADGGPPSGRGFTVLEPVADGPNDKVIASSERLGRDVRSAFLRDTKMTVSTYDGVNGINHRDDLAGLNLSRVPTILIECGNMRNATDAAMLTSTRFQQQAARALEAAIIAFRRNPQR
ncbi:MAG TPA: N-acetylmuramoyl-L-alanine amidase [Streptosporangiaceae bacterium]|nr:N-acetylmuramoyl-L-alanine amidase [Streptosporangiaceae bacterium]